MDWEPRAVVAIEFGTHGGGFAWTARTSADDPLTRAIGYFPRPAAVRPASASGQIASYLTETRQAVLAEIAATASHAEDEIRWCITIPAIWDEQHKASLRRAARDAGLPVGEDRLLLLAEPEAAALYCQVRMAGLAGCRDQRFVVVHCGDGTVDIAAYRYCGVQGRDGLEEIGVASSGTFAPGPAAVTLPESVTSAIAAKVAEQFVSVRRTSGLGSADQYVGREPVVVVGGLAATTCLTGALGSRFGAEHRVLAAPSAALCVLEGALRYTCDPRTLAARRSRYTYGFAVAMPWEAGIDAPARRFRDDDERIMCRDRFAVAVHRMDRLAVDEPVTILVEPAFADSPEVTVQLFRAQTADPRYVDEEGCELAGELAIDVRRTVGQLDRQIALLLYLGRSQIQVEAVDLTTNKKFETATDFAAAAGGAWPH